MQQKTTEAIATALIHPSPFQRREATKKDVETLAASIKSKGLINAIVVRPHPKKKTEFELVAGERRLRAFKLLGEKFIYASIRQLTDSEARDILTIENLERKDLTPIEEANNINDLLEGGKRTYEDISAEIGRPVKWIARRAHLVNLSPSWVKGIGPGKFFEKYTAGHLELIARYDKKEQEAIYNSFGHWAANLSIKALAEELAERMQKLSSAKFPLDSAAFIKGVGPCIQCNKRSSCKPNLFDEGAGSIAKNDMCLDKKCFETKQKRYIETQFEQAKKDHGNKLITARAPGLSLLNHDHAIMKNALSSHEAQKCKKDDKGATPAFMANGPAAGSVVYIKASTKASSKKIKGATKTLKERRQELKRRRNVVFINEVIKILDEEIFKPEFHIEKMRFFEIAALAATFGMAENLNQATTEYGKLVSTGCGFIDELGKRREPARQHTINMLMLHRVIPNIIDRLREEAQYHADKPALACWIANLFPINGGGLQIQAKEQIPEPRSWANLNEDGTPKAAPAKKKKAGKKK